MGLFLNQLILAARRTDGDESGWSQLVVFLILAVFWAVGGILKARNEKEKQQKKHQQTETFRPIKPPQKRLAERYQIQRQPAPQQVKPAVRPIVREPGAGSKPIVRSRPAVSKPVEYPKQPPKPIFKEQKAYKAEPKGKTAFSQKSETAALAIPIQTLAALDSPDELRTAILHYEILGQCIALRESENKVWQC